MQVPVETLDMKKSEREIIRLFSKLSVKKRNRVTNILNDMSKEKVENEKKNKKVEVYAVENASERTFDSLIEHRNLSQDDGTHGDCDLNPRVTKKQLDRELDEYMAAYPDM
jgi:hypothetical protein